MNDYISYGLAPQRCAICATKSSLLQCGGCKVISYCGAAHQSVHRPMHKAACTAIRKSREALEKEEAALRANPGDSFYLPADVFNTGVGRFWGLAGTRDYMRARFAAARALLEVNTLRAVEKALEHYTDMLRLCRSDNMGVRDIIPDLLLRLGREQECYDFLKWWAVIDDKDHYDGHYDWADVTLPYLDIHGADVFESTDMFSKYTSLSHLVTLTLLKLRLFLDLSPFELSYLDFDSDDSFLDFDRPIGTLIREKMRGSNMFNVSRTMQVLEGQYRKLCQVVNDANPHFWEALVNEYEPPHLPSYITGGSVEEANLVLYQCRRAWQETEDAIVMIDSETCRFTRAYKGPAAVAGTSDTRSTCLAETTDALERRRGTGITFPSRFNTPLPTSCPGELFPATLVDTYQVVRFICRSNPRKALVYVDGACTNNGQQNPRAGWAVVYGPPGPDKKSGPGIARGRLENKGPFGDESVATSNRAELRASIAALRLCDWRVQGFDSVVIATDSSYVVDGATGWVRGWVRNGWKTRTGGDVKNKDLWDLLLGEVERWKDHGLGVELWKIPRGLNADADAAAKQVASDGADEVEFRDVVTAPPPTTAARTGPGRRVLALCLENESLFDQCCGSLVSLISSNAEMERAATHEAALGMLNQEPPPSIILIADAGLLLHREILECVIDRLREGATVVLAGLFSSMLTMGQFNRFFAKIGLPWERGSYHQTTVNLRSNVVDSHLTNHLPPAYSVKALFAKNVERSAAWYTESDDSGETAVAFAEVGKGRLGYIGDVNGEQSSNEVFLAMCGFLG